MPGLLIFIGIGIIFMTVLKASGRRGNDPSGKERRKDGSGQDDFSDWRDQGDHSEDR